MNIETLARAMLQVARESGIVRQAHYPAWLTLQLASNQWLLSISQQNERLSQADEDRIRLAFDIPDDAKWTMDIQPSRPGDRALADDECRWYVVRLSWPDMPVQETMFDEPDESYYSRE